MLGRAHVALTLAAASGAALLLYGLEPWATPETLGAFVCASLFGALLPDIDRHNSALGRFTLGAVERWLKHRGPCHSLALTALAGLVLGLAFRSPPLGAGVAFGAWCHLAQDFLFTPTGQPLLWPLSALKWDRRNTWRRLLGGTRRPQRRSAKRRGVASLRA